MAPQRPGQRRKYPSLLAIAGSALGFAAALAGCAKAPPPPPAPGSPVALQRALVLPLNTTTAAPPEVEAGLAAVQAALEAGLRRRGLEVEALAPARAHDEWYLAALATRRAAPDEPLRFQSVAATLARRLAKESPFDLLLVPWIAMRDAELLEGRVAWDGVKRKLGVAGSAGMPGKWALTHLHLTLQEPSLQVVGLLPDGERLFEGVGGLDLVDDGDVGFSGRKLRFETTPRATIFDDRANLREGVDLALAGLPTAGVAVQE